MRYHVPQKGFTFVEIMIVVALIVFIGTIALTAFYQMADSSALRASGNEVYGALTRARTSTLSSQNDTVYGVRISSTTVTRFTGASYAKSSASNVVYAFERGVTATGTLVTSVTDIVFRRLTGEPNTYGLIYLRDSDKKSTTTIRIQRTGLVEYD